MIISFAQTAEYWRQQSDAAFAEGRMREALLYARKALMLDASFDVWYTYADLLNRVEQYDMSVSVCLRYGHNMADDERADWCRLMVDNAERMGDLAAALHYDKMLLEMRQDENVSFEDIMEDFLHQMFQEDSHKLVFAKEAHTTQNRRLYERMVDAYEHKDYQGVVELGEGMHPDYDFYVESLFLLGMAQISLGEESAGRANLYLMYELSNHDARILYHLDEVPEGMTHEAMLEALAKVDTTSNKENLAVAAICAYRHGLDEEALRLAQCAYELMPDAPEGIFRLACAHCNVGHDELAAQYLRMAITEYEDFFPLFLTHVCLVAPVDLSFDVVPSCLQEEALRWVRFRMQQDYFAILMLTEEEFRHAVHFLLLYPMQDVVAQSRLAEDVLEWQGTESIAFARELLLEPTLPTHVRHKLVLKLLMQVRRGKAPITMRYVARLFSLRVSPSFDAFDSKLQRAYAYAFCEMIGFGHKAEAKLSRIAEKVFLTPPDFDYHADMLGLAMACVGHFAPENKHIERLVAMRDWDEDVFWLHVDAVRHAQKPDK